MVLQSCKCLDLVAYSYSENNSNMSFKFNFMNDDCTESSSIASTHFSCDEKDDPKSSSNARYFTLDETKELWKESLIQGLYTVDCVKLTTDCTLHYVQPCKNALELTKKRCSSGKGIDTTEDTDLVTQVYEGGLKVWEASVDLVKFLSENNGVVLEASVLELGCGIGLPGVYAATCGATRVTFQDFNDFVLTQATAPTLMLNKWLVSSKASEHDTCQHLLQSGNLHETLLARDFPTSDDYQFVVGDWSAVKSNLNEKFDVILTSETIYSVEYYDRLHSLLQHALKRTGSIFLSAKSYYFGVGGGITSWIDFLNEKKVFTSKIVETINAPLRREILEMKFIVK